MFSCRSTLWVEHLRKPSVPSPQPYPCPDPIRASDAHWGPAPMCPECPAVVPGLSRAPARPALGSPPNPVPPLQPQPSSGLSGLATMPAVIQLWRGHNRVPLWFSKTNLSAIFPPWYQVMGRRSEVWCLKRRGMSTWLRRLCCASSASAAAGLATLQILSSLTSTCLLSWDWNRSLHPCANYSLIISAYQNAAFQLPFILLFACQITSPFPRCSHCVQGWQS